MLNCRFCSRVCKNDNSLRNHERLCSENPLKQTTCFSDPNLQQKFSKQNQYTKAKLLGLDAPIVSDETRKKLSIAAKYTNANASFATKEKRKQTIQRKVLNGEWHTSLAKRMHYQYKGIDLHGKWEFGYAIWLDENCIAWQRCRESFEYTFEEKVRRYTPDFYLPETDTYIEIKGYKTKKDDAKWSQFPAHRTLKVLMEDDLIALGVNLNSREADK